MRRSPMRFVLALVVGLAFLSACATALSQGRAVRPVQAAGSVALPPATEPSRPRVALVIGNAAYRNVPRLDNPVRDARAVCAQVKGLGFDTECLEDLGTRREMRAAVQRYVDRLKSGAIGLFYFAGHGVQKRGENFLLPIEANITRVADIDEESLSLGYLMEAVAESRAFLNLVIVDACRENMLSKSLELMLPRGFAAIDAPPNSVVFYSTAPGRFALDGGSGSLNGHSPFARQVVRHLADDGIVLEEFFKRVTAGVQAETKGQQTPWFNSSFTGTFCFGQCPRLASPDEIARVSAEKQEVEEKLRQLEVDRERREREVSKLAERVRELEAMTQQRQQELQGMREAGRQSATRAADQTERLRRELEQLRQANAALTEERSRLAAQREEKVRLEALSGELTERIRQVEKLQAENERLRRQAEALNRELDAAEQARRRAEGAPRTGDGAPRAAPPPPAF